jgi:hypothetical protein
MYTARWRVTAAEDFLLEVVAELESDYSLGSDAERASQDTAATALVNRSRLDPGSADEDALVDALVTVAERHHSSYEEGESGDLPAEGWLAPVTTERVALVDFDDGALLIVATTPE